MFDIDALLAAGFRPELESSDDWETFQKQVHRQYERSSASGPEREPGGDVTVDYLLIRGQVRLLTEQNTQRQSPFGIETTVHYPQIVILEHTETGRRVTCEAANTQLILALAEELGRVLDQGLGPELPQE